MGPAIAATLLICAGVGAFLLWPRRRPPPLAGEERWQDDLFARRAAALGFGTPTAATQRSRLTTLPDGRPIVLEWGFQPGTTHYYGRLLLDRAPLVCRSQGFTGPRDDHGDRVCCDGVPGRLATGGPLEGRWEEPERTWVVSADGWLSDPAIGGTIGFELRCTIDVAERTALWDHVVTFGGGGPPAG